LYSPTLLCRAILFLKKEFRRQGQHVLLAMVWIQVLQMDHPQLQLALPSRWT
jgi:hypothetical protein